MKQEREFLKEQMIDTHPLTHSFFPYTSLPSRGTHSLFKSPLFLPLFIWVVNWAQV